MLKTYWKPLVHNVRKFEKKIPEFRHISYRHDKIEGSHRYRIIKSSEWHSAICQQVIAHTTDESPYFDV